jgi:hypothetical protein
LAGRDVVRFGCVEIYRPDGVGRDERRPGH